MPKISTGPFSSVYFFHTTRRGLRTYTDREGREACAGAAIEKHTAVHASGVAFTQRFVDTSALRAN